MEIIKSVIVLLFLGNGFLIGNRLAPKEKTITKYVTEVKEIPITKIALKADKTIYGGLLYSNAERVDVRLTVNEHKIVKDTTIISETTINKYPYEWVRKLEMPPLKPVVLRETANVDLCYNQINE